jgi:hypothetical protein
VKIKTFNEFERRFSQDPSTFSKQVAIASAYRDEHPFFSIVKNQSELSETYQGYPVIIDEGFSIGTQAIYESSVGAYNSKPVPSIVEISNKLSDNPYIPKISNNIKDIRKGFRFPIIAKRSSGSDSYKTIGKLRSSGINYSEFIENPEPKTRFKILAFKGEPISIVEWINKFPLDVDIDSFDYLKESNELSSTIWENFNLELCNIEIIESVKGDIMIKSIDTNLNLNPAQEKIVYERVYEDHYNMSLPNWFKKQIFESHVLPYYKRRANDVKLIKSRHTIDYSKLF